MEKPEARDFVLQRLQLGYEKEEIVKDLCQRLGAPSELVLRFVNQVSENYLRNQNSGISPFVIIDQKEKIENETGLEDKAMDQSGKDDSISVEGEASIDEIVTLEQKSSEYEEERSAIEQAESQSRNEFEEISIVNDINIPELEQLTLQNIKKLYRHNDIVEQVCEKTGWSWNKAQRFVAKTQTKNHQELTRSSRIFMIIFCIIFIIGGLLLLLWSVLTFKEYRNGWTGQITSTLSMDLVSFIIGGFFTSLGIILGGIYGLYRTLSNQ